MCNHCGCRKHDLINRYMVEHEEVMGLLAQLDELARNHDVTGLRTVGRVVADALVPHNVDEEKGLFAVLLDKGQYVDDVKKLTAEHVELKRLIHRIQEGDPHSVPEFTALLRAHIHLEDTGLYPGAAFVLTPGEWEALDVITPSPPAA